MYKYPLHKDVKLRFRQTQKTEVFFINVTNINPQISLILLNVVPFYNLCSIFCRYMFKNEVIGRYMHCIMQNLFKKCTGLHILSI